MSLSGYDLINSSRCSTREPPSRIMNATCSSCTGSCRAPCLGSIRGADRAPDVPALRTSQSLRQIQPPARFAGQNETLFYALLVRSIEEMLPLVIRRRWARAASVSAKSWRKPRGVFLSYPNDRIGQRSSASALRRREVHRGERRGANPGARRPRRRRWASPSERWRLHGVGRDPSGALSSGSAGRRNRWLTEAATTPSISDGGRRGCGAGSTTPSWTHSSTA